MLAGADKLVGLFAGPGLWLWIAATILAISVGFGVVYAAATFVGMWLAVLIVVGALALFAAIERQLATIERQSVTTEQLVAKLTELTGAAADPPPVSRSITSGRRLPFAQSSLLPGWARGRFASTQFRQRRRG